MTEVGCGKCGSVMERINESSEIEVFKCPNCGRVVKLGEGDW